MSGRISFGKPLDRLPASTGGGVATGAEILGAAWEQMRLVENTTAAGDALEQAYEDWRRDIRAGTGVEPPPNPVTSPLQPGLFGPTIDQDALAIGNQADRVAAFDNWVRETAGRYPEEATRSWAFRNAEQDAARLARTADQQLATLMDSNPGWGKHVTAFAGAAASSLRDPLVAGSLFLGGGPGAAKTVAGRILTVAAKEALLNGGTTLAAQPIVQDWRRRAGLAYGFDEAARNVLFAAGVGGVFGAGARGLGEAASGLGQRGRARRLVEDFARSQPELSEVARRALDGDTSAATELLAPIRDVLPPEVRAAIDEAEIEAARVAERQAELAHQSARRAQDLENRAIVAAQMRQMPDLVVADTPRINRLVRELAPRPESITDPAGVLAETSEFSATLAEIRAGRGDGTAAARRPVTNWLRQLGGVAPDGRLADELRAIGITSRNSPGLFSGKGRAALDNLVADELPAEIRQSLRQEGDTGYISEQSIVDALEAEIASPAARASASDAQRTWLEDQGVDFDAPDDVVLRQMEEINAAEARYMAAEENGLGLRTEERAQVPPGMTRKDYTAQVVSEILRRVGDGVGDDVIKAAADLHLHAGETLEDAIDFALSDKAGVTRTLPESKYADLPDDPPAPREDAPIDPEDADPIDWDAFEAEGFGSEVQIPWGDELVGLEALKKEIDDADWLERVVEACKL